MELTWLLRRGEELEKIEEIDGRLSSRLGIRFELKEETLEIYRPDGQRFLTSVELEQLREQEQQRANEASAQLKQKQQRYQALLERLRERGSDPEHL